MRTNGIVYRINNTLCATVTSEVSEVIQNAKAQSVPLTRPWLSGVIHVRGSIIPVTDFEAFINEQKGSAPEQVAPVPNDRSSNAIIIFNQDNWAYGIKISHILGLQNFEIEEISEDVVLPNNLSDLREIITGTATIYGEKAYLLSLPKLTNIRAFMQPHHF